ncbi:MAG: response regulator [Alphaproteobacteria bacterium]|nr:response regulator [Alphaproteobacteria bacterium]MDE2112592.1 response regulator [Alphaproteobacteria bacterium]MDE2494077.1 response regulator [Alphaproteobacteria bacterium]
MDESARGLSASYRSARRLDNLENSTVYLVDDDFAVRESLQALLESEGFRVADFATGQAFLDAASELAKGCLVLDLRMPEVDGFQVLETLRTRGIRIPTIVLTGHGDASVEERVRQAGARCMLHKPVQEEELFKALRAALVAQP